VPRSLWITAQEAAAIISKNNNRTVTDQHVRDYAKKGRIKYRARDGRTNEYLKSDVDRLRIRKYTHKKSNQEEKQMPLEIKIPLDEVA
jgi:hypothetical protein